MSPKVSHRRNDPWLRLMFSGYLERAEREDTCASDHSKKFSRLHPSTPGGTNSGVGIGKRRRPEQHRRDILSRRSPRSTLPMSWFLSLVVWLGVKIKRKARVESEVTQDDVSATSPCAGVYHDGGLGLLSLFGGCLEQQEMADGTRLSRRRPAVSLSRCLALSQAPTTIALRFLEASRSRERRHPKWHGHDIISPGSYQHCP
ncbi:uncharacterized protein J3D65DRAFT_615883 [Phyllosticta citribraziliensis]|uniref:Uncharacterized protein n=1 Tax=Phyllosticta citribraziliensis TaxID=989973 RepID=A0ABR1M3F2_9PEZI